MRSFCENPTCPALSQCIALYPRRFHQRTHMKCGPAQKDPAQRVGGNRLNTSQLGTWQARSPASTHIHTLMLQHSQTHATSLVLSATESFNNDLARMKRILNRSSWTYALMIIELAMATVRVQPRRPSLFFSSLFYLTFLRDPLLIYIISITRGTSSSILRSTANCLTSTCRPSPSPRWTSRVVQGLRPRMMSNTQKRSRRPIGPPTQKKLSTLSSTWQRRVTRPATATEEMKRERRRQT